jgi:NADP-dependent 3-hydroxy acid dehydrogenase YdfG
MAKPLEGTVAFVTGASSGIGEVTAQRLAADGAAVVLVARRLHRLEALASSIRADGGSALVIEADIAERAEAERAVQRTVSELGRLDTLVNNAGVMLLGPALEAPLEEWDRMIAINLQGALYTTHASLAHLVAAAKTSPRGVADIVMISSTAGRVARPGAGVYALTKFGLGAFAESLRQELIKQRVRVSIIEPGSVATDLVTHVREGIREDASAVLQSITPLQPEDIADAVSYIVTRNRRAAINELLIRSAEQTW